MLVISFLQDLFFKPQLNFSHFLLSSPAFQTRKIGPPYNNHYFQLYFTSIRMKVINQYPLYQGPCFKNVQAIRQTHHSSLINPTTLVKSCSDVVWKQYVTSMHSIVASMCQRAKVTYEIFPYYVSVVIIVANLLRSRYEYRQKFI